MWSVATLVRNSTLPTDVRRGRLIAKRRRKRRDGVSEATPSTGGYANTVTHQLPCLPGGTFSALS